MTGVLVLAAGASSRMGRPKQLLVCQGRTLLRRAVDTALATALGPVVVVLGAEAEKCRASLGELEVVIIVNSEWEEGMGSSIRAGMFELRKIGADLDGVLITLHDQAAIESARLSALVRSRQGTEQIVASAYDDVVGVPAWFSRELFGDLYQLDGRHGAQTLIRSHAFAVRRFEMPEARDDIDTPAGYQRIREKDVQLNHGI